MPWKVETVMSQRQEFVTLAQADGVNLSELCRRFGISRKTGYQWLRRYRADGLPALQDRSPRPRRSPRRTSPAVEQRVVARRHAHPTKGSHVLARMLTDRGDKMVLAKSTSTTILRRHDRIAPAESAKRQPYQRFEHAHPNELWPLDCKGHFPLGSGGRCHPLTVLDDHSRFSLGVRACANEPGPTVQGQLTASFQHYGLPTAMLVDNGPPWGQDRAHPFPPLTVWLLHLGIRVVHSRPDHPQPLGKLERFQRSLQAELRQGHHCPDLGHCQARFDRWRHFYNLERPHHALALDTPASRYTLSPRPFPAVLPRLEYAADDEVRTVAVSGRISFRGRGYRVGKAFRGQRVALRPPTTDGTWQVCFAAQPITTSDLRP